METKYTLQQVRAASKPVDAWFTVLFIDPIAQRIVWLLANFTSIGPNMITILSLIFWLGAAALYCQGSPASVATAAIIFLAGFMLDCVDGKLARLKGSASSLGGQLDQLGGYVCIIACLIALIGSFYLQTGNKLSLFLGIIFSAYLVGYPGFPLYEKLLKPKLAKLRFHGTPVWQSKPGSLTTPRFRSFRLTVLPSSVEAQMLVFVAFPLAGMIFQGLVAGVTVAFIEYGALLAQKALLLGRSLNAGFEKR